jgi:hypothetical protein
VVESNHVGINEQLKLRRPPAFSTPPTHRSDLVLLC